MWKYLYVARPFRADVPMLLVGGVKIWHHKTLHKKFKYGIPLIIAIQITAIIYLFKDTIQAYIYP